MKTATRSRIIFFVASVSTVGFSLHLLWEYFQCSPLFIHLKTSPTYWSMICATLGDVSILWVSYFGVVAFNRSLFWPWTTQNAMSWGLFIVVSVVIAEIIEYLAISRELWTYSSANPTLGGVSVIPLFQMASLNPLTILITKKLLNFKRTINQ